MYWNWLHPDERYVGMKQDYYSDFISRLGLWWIQVYWRR